MSETSMSAREYFLQMTDPTNWHEGAGPEWAEAMIYVHEGVMEFWDELEENHGSPTALRLQELEAELTSLKTAAGHAICAMRMEKWHWSSGVSNGMKRGALRGLSEAIREPKGGPQ